MAEAEETAAPGWTGLFGAPLLLALGAGAGYLVYERPEPVADIYAEGFSTGWVFTYLPHVAQQPRPVGSEHHDNVRRWLVTEIGDLGIAPNLQAGTRDGVTLTNVVARLPGRDSTGTVLLSCHYDSRPETPGAGDDGVSVVVLLQVLDRLTKESALRNDLIFLFSDGEERGLLGAQLFAEGHAWIDEVTVALNFDHIGNDGPLVMFETGSGSGTLVERYAEVAPHPVATSLAQAVYQQLPNDTDFSVFRDRGLPGLNFAFVGGGRAYHDASDTYQNIDRGSIQLLGETALVMARELGELDLSSLEREERAYFDLVGYRLVHYSAQLASALTIAAFVLLAFVPFVAARRFELVWLDFLYGALLFAGFLVVTAVAGFGLWFAVDRLTGAFVTHDTTPGSNLRSACWTLGGLAAFAAFALTTILERLKRSSDGKAKAGSFAIWGLVVWALPLAALASTGAHSGAQLTVAVGIAAAAFLLAALRLQFPGAIVVVALMAPMPVLIFHLLSKEMAVAVGVAVVFLPSLLGLLAPNLATRTHAGLLRLLLAVASVGLLVTGAVQYYQGG